MCVIWGIPYLLIRVAVREVTPAVLVFGRTAIAALLLLPIAARRGELRGLAPHWRPIVLFAAIELALPWPAARERRSGTLSSSLSGLLVAARARWIGAPDRDLHGRRRPARRPPARRVLVGLAGVAAIAGVSVRTASVVALLEVGVVATSYAVGPIVLSRSLADLPSLGVIAVSLDALRPRLCGARRSPAPRRGAVGPRARIDRDARHRLHGDGVRPLLRPRRRGGPGARHGDHLRQSRRRGAARRDDPRRGVHRRDGNRVRARAGRVAARHRALDAGSGRRAFRPGYPAASATEAARRRDTAITCSASLRLP